MSLPVTILAGGLATRLRPITERVPKILLEVAGRPFAEHQLDLLRHHGITRVIYCVGHLGEQVRDTLGDGRRWGLSLEYVFDGPQLLGTGGALRRALHVLGETFFVLYGDSYLTCDFAAVEKAFYTSQKAGLMTVFRNENVWDKSNVAFTDGRIMRYDKHNTTGMRHIDYGLGVLTRRSFAPYAEGTVFDLATVYQHLLAEDALAGYEVSERFYEIGSTAGLTELNTLLTKTTQLAPTKGPHELRPTASRRDHGNHPPPADGHD